MSNQIQLRERASYSYCTRSWRQQTNPSRNKKTIGSYVICAFIEIWGKCIFRALQISRVLHISMNTRWHMNQLLNVH